MQAQTYKHVHTYQCGEKQLVFNALSMYLVSTEVNFISMEVIAVKVLRSTVSSMITGDSIK